MSFEVEFQAFLEKQISEATGTRLDMLQKELVGEKKLFQEVLWPIFQTFEGFVLEYELQSSSGVKMYMDAYFKPYGIAFESDGYVVHGENISRSRFSFEKQRVRTMAKSGIVYMPFSWDELDKKAEQCRASVYELLSRFRASPDSTLNVYEREAIRYALRLGRPIRREDLFSLLKKSDWIVRNVIKSLVDKSLIVPLKPNNSRHYEYVVDKNAIKFIL
ncbi:hypothetical protein [Paenibacillus chungangensis]|uniref:Transcriptional regulator n=1 Tax=Paenibacillus chungangensis TaxID=696535 RepID=A0ABW3HVC2_9BACL